MGAFFPLPSRPSGLHPSVPHTLLPFRVIGRDGLHPPGTSSVLACWPCNHGRASVKSGLSHHPSFSLDVLHGDQAYGGPGAWPLTSPPEHCFAPPCRPLCFSLQRPGQVARGLQTLFSALPNEKKKDGSEEFSSLSSDTCS